MTKGCVLSTGYLPQGGLSRNCVDRITDRPDMTSVVDNGRKKKKKKKKTSTILRIIKKLWGGGGEWEGQYLNPKQPQVILKKKPSRD